MWVLNVEEMILLLLGLCILKENFTWQVILYVFPKWNTNTVSCRKQVNPSPEEKFVWLKFCLIFQLSHFFQ